MADEKMTPEPDIYDREDQCRKAIRTVGKAVFMRLLVTALLIFVLIGNGMLTGYFLSLRHSPAGRSPGCEFLPEE